MKGQKDRACWRACGASGLLLVVVKTDTTMFAVSPPAARIRIVCAPAMPPRGVCQKQSHIRTFVTALGKCPSAEVWVSKGWHIHGKGHYTATKIKDVRQHRTIRMNLTLC